MSAIFKKYLQCVLAARILTVDFVVCTLAVKKNIRAGFDLADWIIPLRVLWYKMSVHINMHVILIAECE
jgi:hypothetical protein